MSEFLNPYQFAGIIALLGSLIATHLLIHANLSDAPNHARKLHVQSTPTAGGVAIVWGTALASFYLQLAGHNIDNKLFVLILGMASFYAIIGLIDDILDLGSRRRLLLLIVISFAVGLSEYGVRTLPIWAGVNIPLFPIIGAIGTMIWLVLVINCVNFMDGANGLSVGTSAIALLFMSGLGLLHGDVSSATIGLIGASACGGFLSFNASKGSIFAGDVGSYFVGGFMGLLSLALIKNGVSPFLLALCVLPLLSDAILTIFHRISLGENILTPHNLHIYQRLIKTGNSHFIVSARWWVMAIICGIVALLVDKNYPEFAALCFVLMAIIFAMLFRQIRKSL